MQVFLRSVVRPSSGWPPLRVRQAGYHYGFVRLATITGSSGWLPLRVRQAGYHYGFVRLATITGGQLGIIQRIRLKCRLEFIIIFWTGNNFFNSFKNTETKSNEYRHMYFCCKSTPPFNYLELAPVCDIANICRTIWLKYATFAVWLYMIGTFFVSLARQ